MKFKKILILILLFIIVISTLGLTSLKEPKQDIIETILNNYGGEVETYGLTVSFRTKTDLEKDMKAIGYITQYLCENETGFVKTTSTSEACYCIDFSTDNSNGYVERTSAGGENTISININIKGNQKSIIGLKTRIEKAIYNSGEVLNEKLVFFDYFKARIKTKNLREVNNAIIKIIKVNGGKNVDTVKLENGYSNIALTGQYESINVAGTEEDLNFALMSYNSSSTEDCYLIIATPEITISY